MGRVHLLNKTSWSRVRRANRSLRVLTSAWFLLFDPCPFPPRDNRTIRWHHGSKRWIKFLVVSMGNRPIFVVRSGIERGDGSFPRIWGSWWNEGIRNVYTCPLDRVYPSKREIRIYSYGIGYRIHTSFFCLVGQTHLKYYFLRDFATEFSLNEKIIRVSSANFFSSEFPRLEFSCSFRPLNVIRCDERTPKSFIDANSIPSRVRKRNLWIRRERIHFETIYEIRVCYRKATSSRVDKCNRVECESLSHRSSSILRFNSQLHRSPRRDRQIPAISFSPWRDSDVFEDDNAGGEGGGRALSRRKLEHRGWKLLLDR